MDDPLKGPAVPSIRDNSAPNNAAPAAPANQAEPLFRFPPFPAAPEGVKIIPFKNFNEHGIQIFNEDVELDGLGIPTVPLRVNHTTDKSKTTATRLKKQEDVKLESKRKSKGKKGPLSEKMDPVAKAQEQRRQRYLLFAKKEWYEQWAEGEDLRGSRTYDPNLSPIDRIHMASTEFRTGRIWPPGYMKVNYLWDQFRLYVGLLGSPPVWTRTDLPQQDSDDFDDETDSDVELSKIKKEKEKLTRKPKDSDEEDNDEFLFSDEDDTDDDGQVPRNQKDRTNAVNQGDQKPPQAKFRRIPPRTPYALYNIVPIPVSSDEEVRKLLAIAAGRRESRLLKFLADPELSVRIFLSWYLRYESLIWSPNYLVSFPHIVQFFLSFLVRVKALPESERALKKAVDVAKRGILELGRTAKLCRELPDKFGIGMKALYGKRWVEERWKIDFLEDEYQFANNPRSEVDYEINQLPSGADAPLYEVDKETKEQALKRFEEELRAEDVELLSADPINLSVPATDLDTRDAGKGDVPEQNSQSDITVILSKTDSSSCLEVVEDSNTATDSIPLHATSSKREKLKEDATSDSETTQQSQPAVTNAFSSASLDDVAGKSQDQTFEPEIPADDLDWSKPDGKINADEKEAAKAAWEPAEVQPLMKIFGMTTLPLKYDAGGHGGPNKFGVAERSMRKVKAVYKPGEPDKDRKWRGIEEDLTKRLSRVVLAPWPDWDSGGVEVDYNTPRVQGGNLLENAEDGKQRDQSGYAARYAHDSEKDDITVLMEPQVADLVMVGMGMAGVFVQLVPASDDSPRTHTDRGRGRGRGRGSGRFNATGSAGRPQKEFTLWYVEHLQLTVPSFWTAGEEEKPMTREELDDALELDLED